MYHLSGQRAPSPLPLLLLSLLLPSTMEVSLGGSPLYNKDDKILILNTTNFQPSICSSSKAWVVEFYSSWCGHCIHFAPTYKEFAADVFGEEAAAREGILNVCFSLEGSHICGCH